MKAQIQRKICRNSGRARVIESITSCQLCLIVPEADFSSLCCLSFQWSLLPVQCASPNVACGVFMTSLHSMCPSAKRSPMCPVVERRKKTPGSSFQLTVFILASKRVNACGKSAEKKHLDSCSAEFTNALGVLWRAIYVWNRKCLTMRAKGIVELFLEILEVYICMKFLEDLAFNLCFYVIKITWN